MDRRGHFVAGKLFASDTALEDSGLPEIVEIEPIHTCNFRCIMCHVSYENLTKQQLDFNALRRSIESMPGLSGKWGIVGASHEPTAHPRFPEIVQILTDAGMKIDLTTNGLLFTDRLIDRVRGGRFANVTISFDGARRESYERIRRRAKYDDTLRMVRAFKSAIGNAETYYTVNYTALRSNCEEIAEAVDLWDINDFDHMGVIAMVMRDDNPLLRAEMLDVDLFREALFDAAESVIENKRRITISSPMLDDPELHRRYPENTFGNIVTSNHAGAILPLNCRPYFQEGYHPDVLVGCRSPYKAVRILFSGQVMLCNHFPIGNIHEKTLAEIWDGEEARNLRAKIKKSADLCNECDFYKFCIKASSVNPADPENQKSANLRRAA